MPQFGKLSAEKLATCHPDLQRLFNEVVKHRDCSVLWGHRGEADQNKAFAEGKSKKKWPDGEHNSLPSRAIDVAPFPIDWNDTRGCYYFAGYVMRVADELGIGIRYGGDWDRDLSTRDQTFNDLVHFELL